MAVRKIAENVSFHQAVRERDRAVMEGRKGARIAFHVPGGFIAKIFHYMPSVSYRPMTFDVLADGDV